MMVRRWCNTKDFGTCITNFPKSSMYYQVLVVLLVQTPMYHSFRSHHKLSKNFHVLWGPCCTTCSNSNVLFVSFSSQTFQNLLCTIRSLLYYLFKLPCTICSVQFTNVPKSSMYYQVPVLLLQPPMYCLFRPVEMYLWSSAVWAKLKGKCRDKYESLLANHFRLLCFLW